MTYRKKWEKNWDSVKFCSDRCRGQAKLRKKADIPIDSEFGNPPKLLEDQIMVLLSQRGQGKTICPSEVLTEADKQNPEKMEEVRQAARRLVAKGFIEITQKGQVVELSKFKGPIRLRLKNKL